MAIEVPKIDPTTKAILEPKTNAAISKKVADDITAGNTPVATALNAASVQAQGMAYTVTADMAASDIVAVLTGLLPGQKVIFSPGTYAAPEYGFPVHVSNVEVDASRASFTQNVWGRPVFDIYNTNRVTLSVGYAEYIGARGGEAAYPVWRGLNSYGTGTVIWCNGDYNRLYIRHAKGFVSGIYFPSWGGTKRFEHRGVGNHVRIDEIEQFNFGVLWEGQENLVIEHIYGHDDVMDVATNPTHLLYGSATENFRDVGVSVLSAQADRINYGQAYQFKHSDRLKLRNMSAHDGAGLFNGIWCDDMDLDGMTGTGMKRAHGLGTFTLQASGLATTSQRPKMSNVTITQADNVDERAFSSISEYGTYTNIRVHTKHTASIGSGVQDINVRGKENTLINFEDRQLGSKCRGITIGGGVWDSSKTRIVNPVVRNATMMVNLWSGSKDVVVEFNPDAQDVTTFFSLADGSGTETYKARTPAVYAP